MKRIHSSNLHYFILILGLTILGSLLVMFQLNWLWSKMIIVAMGFYYFAWGLVHHFLSKDLHVKIVLEYLLIALLGIVLLLSLSVRM